MRKLTHTKQDDVMGNPWMEQHVAGEMAFTGEGYTRAKARAAVSNEFADGPEPEACGNCGDTAYYRATVGALMCPACRAIEYGVWVHKQTGEERRGNLPGHLGDQYRLERRWTEGRDE